MGDVIRVLLVEDSELDAALTLHTIRKGGARVESERVQDAAGLRAALARGSWDVVVSDWSMPQFSALDALAIVRQAHANLAFVVVSGTIGEDAAKNALAAGADACLDKSELAKLPAAVDVARLARSDAS